MTDDPTSGARRGGEHEPPPVLTTWRNLYLVVLGELGLLVLLFWLVTRWAS